MRFVHLLIPAAACLVASRASAAPLRSQARGPAVWKTEPLRRNDEFGTVSYCVGQDFDPAAGPCVQEQSVEPFGTCFSLAGGPFDKTVASFATSACTGCELFSDDECTQSVSFLAADVSIGNGGGGDSVDGPSGVGFFGGQMSSFRCAFMC